MDGIERLEVCEVCGQIATEQIMSAAGNMRYFCLAHLTVNETLAAGNSPQTYDQQVQAQLAQMQTAINLLVEEMAALRVTVENNRSYYAAGYVELRDAVRQLVEGQPEPPARV